MEAMGKLQAGERFDKVIYKYLYAYFILRPDH